MTIIESLDTEFGTIEIIHDPEHNTLTYSQGACFHSQANADGVSTCAYVHLMQALIRQQKAKNVLMIGCAGGTLATMLHRENCAVTVVDINPHAFTLARRYFLMPPEIECVVGEGLEYLKTTPNRYDAVALDVFTNKGHIPNAFMQPQAFAAIADVLVEAGVVVMNTLLAHDMDGTADYVGFAMEAAGYPAMIFECAGRPEHNAIVAGGRQGAVPFPAMLGPDWMAPKMQKIIRREPNAQLQHRVVL